MSQEVDRKTTIEPMTPEDLDSVMAIENLSFSSPWPRSSFVHELKLDGLSYNLVIRYPNSGFPRGVAGYVCFWHVVDEVHITNLAVHPDLRRHGLGRSLIREVRRFAAAHEARRLLLEVRRSNVPAQNLYRGLGFSPIGVRRGYYEDTREDALVMELILP